MQNGPRFLTDNDINTVVAYSPLAPGGSDGAWTPGATVDLSQLGQVGQTGDGRFYRFVLVGGTSTVAPAQLLVAPAAPANSTGLAIPTTQPSNTAQGNTSTGVSALQKGSRALNVTNGSTAVTADQFAGGYLEVLQTSGTNEGPVSYKVAGNSAAAANGVITVRLAEPLAQPETLVAGTDTVNLRVNPYANVAASSTVGQPVGVTTVQVPNSASQQYLAWVQTQGHAVVQCSSTVAVGNAVKQSSSTAGSVTVTSAVTDFEVGVALNAVTSSGVASVQLSLI